MNSTIESTPAQALPGLGFENQHQTADKADIAVAAARLCLKAAWLPIAAAGKVGGVGLELGFKTAGKELDPKLAKGVATVMAAAITAAGMVHGYEELTKHDAPTAAFSRSCDDNGHDAGHEAVFIGDSSKVDGLLPKNSVRGNLNKLSLGHAASDNRTWTNLADYLSGPQGRGYTMTPVALAALNTGLATYDDHGKLKPDIAKYGPACINLPGPTFSGILISDGKTKASDIARTYSLSVAQLEALNPGITTAGQVVEKGKVIRTRQAVDTSLALQHVDKKRLSQITDGAVIDKIKQANDMDVAPGADAYLPLWQTPEMTRDKVTTAGEVQQYQAAATHIAQNQTVAPKVEKTPNNVESVAYALDKQQLKMINDLDAPKYQKDFIKELLPIIMQTVQDGYHWDPAALLGMAADESSWGTSQIARNGYNLFGVKAMSDWHGPVLDANGSEENTNGSSTGYYEMSWRQYDSYYASLKDFGLFLGNHKWFEDATKCDQTSLTFLEGMEYKLGSNCKMLPGQPIPGSLEPAHASEHKYVKIIENNFIKPYQMQQIIDAGAPYKIARG